MQRQRPVAEARRTLADRYQAVTGRGAKTKRECRRCERLRS
jgi:hypothetical protein